MLSSFLIPILDTIFSQALESTNIWGKSISFFIDFNIIVKIVETIYSND